MEERKKKRKTERQKETNKERKKERRKTERLKDRKTKRKKDRKKQKNRQPDSQTATQAFVELVAASSQLQATGNWRPSATCSYKRRGMAEKTEKLQGSHWPKKGGQRGLRPIYIYIHIYIYMYNNIYIGH